MPTVIFTSQNRLTHGSRFFSPYGEFIELIEFDSNGKKLFTEPYDIEIDANGNFYVAEYLKSTINVFDPDWNLLYTLGDSVEVSFPRGMTFDTEGNVFIAATYGIQVFDSAGEFLYEFPLPEYNGATALASDVAFGPEAKLFVTWYTSGGTDGGGVYVLDPADGTLLQEIVIPAEPVPDQNYSAMYAGNIVVGPDGYMYVRSLGLKAIDPEGTILRSSGMGFGRLQFDSVMVGNLIYMTVNDHVEVASVTPEFGFTQGVLNGNARFRAGPGTTYDVVGAMDAGGYVLIFETDETGEWLRIRYNGEDAWVAAFLVNQTAE